MIAVQVPGLSRSSYSRRNADFDFDLAHCDVVSFPRNIDEKI